MVKRTAALIVTCTLAAQEPASPAPVRATPAELDASYVEIIDVPLPEDIVVEVGGIVCRGSELFVCTRRGEIWNIVDAYSDAPQARLWAEGLQEPLGLIEHQGWLYCGQRGELSRMRDSNGDGRMDELETVAQGWPLSGNYHEYCFGPTLAPDGTMWLTLNKPFGNEPFGRADWRGWAIRVPTEPGSVFSPCGQFEPVCAGLRSPAGVATAPWGEVWYTDNQGEWCATSKFTPLAVGDFHGHPHGIDSCKLEQSRVEHPGEVKSGIRMAEAVATIPNYRLPAVWIPYDKLGRSPAGFVWDTEGRFGPYRDQIFCGDQYSAEIFRMTIEKVRGRFQGACYPFRRGLKCGVTRLSWGHDGTLWCGLTDRGWGSLGKRQHGLQRLSWKRELPFDLLEVTARPDGFRLRFSKPVQSATALPLSFAVSSWTYDLHKTYGCDPRDVRELQVRAAESSADGMTLDLVVDGMLPCYVHEIDCEGLRSRGGEQLWHPTAWYTLNALP